MKKLAIILCLLATFAGCRNGRHSSVHLEALGAERRWLEDQLWDAKHQIDAQEDQLRKLEEENRKLKKQLEGVPPFETPTASPNSTGSLPNIEIDIGAPTEGVPVPPEPDPLPKSDESATSKSSPPTQKDDSQAKSSKTEVITGNRPGWTPRKAQSRVARQPESGELPSWSPNR